MATSKLTPNYRPRVIFNEKFGIEHPANGAYVDSLAGYLLTRIKSSARPYHKKHKGVKDNGNEGKLVTITKDELKRKIIETKGKSPDGTRIYFGPIGYLSNPTQAIKFGFMTSEQNGRKPSADRIDSGKKEYSFENIQITTKKFNLGKSDDDNPTSSTSVKIEVGNVNILLDNCTPQYLAAYTQSLAA